MRSNLSVNETSEDPESSSCLYVDDSVHGATYTTAGVHDLYLAIPVLLGDGKSSVFSLSETRKVVLKCIKRMKSSCFE